jgi:pimeloyl-ACP methyl ester carboxylesterase
MAMNPAGAIIRRNDSSGSTELTSPFYRHCRSYFWTGRVHEVHLLDTGHFALETHAEEIAQLILEFLCNAIPEKAERLR